MLLKVSDGMFINLDFFERLFALEVPHFGERVTLVAALTYWDGEPRLVEGISKDPFEGSLRLDGVHFLFADVLPPPPLSPDEVLIGFVVDSAKKVMPAVLEEGEGGVFLLEGRMVLGTDHGIETEKVTLRALVQGEGEDERAFLRACAEKKFWILV